MQGKTSCARGKGKVVETSKRPRRKVPRFNRGTIQVPEDFLKTESIRIEGQLPYGNQSHHFRDPYETLNTYTLEGPRPSFDGPSSEEAFTPDDAVKFMCINVRNFIRSTEGEGLGKMSNDDSMRLAAFHTWTYKGKVKKAWEIITRLKKEIPERAIDQWVKTDEYMDALGVEYVRGSTETKHLITRVVPNFYFDKLEECIALKPLGFDCGFGGEDCFHATCEQIRSFSFGVASYVYDQNVAKKKLAHMITMHEYPLSMVEHEGFREYCMALQPAFKSVSRNTIKKEIMGIYDVEKVKTTSLLEANNCRISITTDLWTASS
ncbi:hypothetical protein JRO89_XS03G0106200 [Xanthoceras sorbifolium]|uniref:Uncharacterized protein n=1 Tax=Xanthoceras sorbifolium TaxID=99658 RepID=A0ABQ8I9H0_9ROSI|nr:hypothetical protein JRO89_XS03G0106200 [Xanthoceras sorbifolium]